MNTYLMFKSDGKLFQLSVMPEPLEDEYTYVNIDTLDYELNVFEYEYEFVNGKVVQLTPEVLIIPDSKLWEDFRVERNIILNKSDWTQVSDAPVDSSAWSTYRQELRDLPSNVVDINNVTWPTPPE
tara:strand:- start:16 stop:393 length:378 start_codon:yes stop_codon:yes gene_type:complete